MVEHACQNCGAAVDDSSPFCPSCGASQIQFLRPESSPTVVNVQRVVLNASQALSFGLEAPPVAPEVVSGDSTRALRSAISAAAIAAVLSALPFGFILALPLGGFLSVLLYRRRGFSRELSPAAGFRLGALTGVFAFAMFVVLVALETLISHSSGDLREMMLEAVRRAQLRNPDPQAGPIFEYLKTAQGLIVMMITGLIFLCVVFGVLAGIGGSISASLNQRKRPPL